MELFPAVVQAVGIVGVHLGDDIADVLVHIHVRLHPGHALLGGGVQRIHPQAKGGLFRLGGLVGGSAGADQVVLLNAVVAQEKVGVFAFADGVDAPVLVLQIQHHRLVVLAAHVQAVQVIVQKGVLVQPGVGAAVSAAPQHQRVQRVAARRGGQNAGNGAALQFQVQVFHLGGLAAPAAGDPHGSVGVQQQAAAGVQDLDAGVDLLV